LAGLKERLMAPELVETFVEEFKGELRRAGRDAEDRRVLLRRALVDVDRKIAGIMKAIEDGNYNQTLTKRLSALEVEKAEIDAKLAEMGTSAKIEIHPNLFEVYRRKVEKLEQALAAPDTQTEAGEVLRSLIDRIELTPGGDQMQLKLCGDLATIIAFTDPQNDRGPAREARPRLSVVAGERNHFYRTTITLMPWRSRRSAGGNLGH
jgi:hypothetical protein